MKTLAFIGLVVIYLTIAFLHLWLVQEYPEQIGFILSGMFWFGYIHSYVQKWWNNWGKQKDNQ